MPRNLLIWIKDLFDPWEQKDQASSYVHGR
jgi:hypothetical protein